ncbi:SDR family oxidoreductase [Salinimicrobium sp. HB62]|uniref:SDR family oxidoreductase n=1 Tax=Salinimicrobium sp. HB62 TaxID=3077781 RepID=UPI002D7938E3|nr:SDR family oxidoreductase [Salinimicrobium sp. HB62]
MFGELEEKVIVVTGASGLIGREVVKYLLEKKARIVALDLNKANEKADYLSCDITDKNDLDKAMEYTLKKYSRIDGLVNLAYPKTKDWGAFFEDIKLESWQRNVDMQMNSVFYLCQKVLDVMKEQKSGSIVNIGSIYGVVGNDFSLYEEYGGTSPAAYAAIKGGIINLSRYLASYYGKFNVRINCVSPGGVLEPEKQHPSFIERYSSKSPLKRLARPEEIATPIAFLLSSESSYITGHNLMVDGGWTAI